jgi:inosine/xanthosine triphosphatase
MKKSWRKSKAMSKRAVVGSGNIVKIEAVRQVLEPFGYEVVGEAVDSLVSDQPLTDEETIKGALNRAQNCSEADLKIGLEAGVMLIGDTLFLTNYGALISGNGKEYFAGGARIPLPDVIKDLILNKRIELAEAMDYYFKTEDIKHNEGAVGYFTNNVVKRVDLFVHIVKLLYGQYLMGGKE